MVLYPIIAESSFQLGRIVGRRGGWFKRPDTASWKSAKSKDGKVIWMHCASSGEFAMGRKVLETFLENNPEWEAVVTFFSPSGYEPYKDYSKAEVYYLPFDAPSQVAPWLDFLNPELAVFIRYDMWPNHLAGLKRRGVSTAVLGLSTPSRPWYLSRLLPLVRSTFIRAISLWGVIEDRDSALLLGEGINAKILGNPKFDYASNVMFSPIPTKFKQWKEAQSKPILLVGSAHHAEIMWLPWMPNIDDFSVWIVPHDVEDAKAMNERILSYGEFPLMSDEHEPCETRVLMIPEYGVLKGLYKLADGVIIGGGFDKAPHNVLEATAQAKVAACGPNWQSIPENYALVMNDFLIPCDSKESWGKFTAQVLEGSLVNKGQEAQEWLLSQEKVSDAMVAALEQTV